MKKDLRLFSEIRTTTAWAELKVMAKAEMQEVQMRVHKRWIKASLQADERERENHWTESIARSDAGTTNTILWRDIS